ncbi:hypothetical protein GCM10028798_28890 [Humibacter antri]
MDRSRPDARQEYQDPEHAGRETYAEEGDARDEREPATADGAHRERLAAREENRFGGMKFGSAFFGWLTATGLTVVIAAILGAIGAGIGASNTNDTNQPTGNPTVSGITGILIFLAILLVAYYAGGYVAGRMARFDGVKQGVAVFIWAAVIAIVVAIIVAIAGSRFDIQAQLRSLPAIGLSPAVLTVSGITTLIAIIVVTLGGAILGGLTGMHYHRKIDRAAFGN